MCLIFLDGTSIMMVVEVMDGKSDAWFKEQLVDADMEEYDEDKTAAPEEVSADVVLAIQNRGYDMLPLPLPPIVAEVGMTRRIAHVRPKKAQSQSSRLSLGRGPRRQRDRNNGPRR